MFLTGKFKQLKIFPDEFFNGRLVFSPEVWQSKIIKWHKYPRNFWKGKAVEDIDVRYKIKIIRIISC